MNIRKPTDYPYMVMVIEEKENESRAIFKASEIEKAIDSCEQYALVEAIEDYSIYKMNWYNKTWEPATAEQVYNDLEEEEYITSQEQGD